jgi:hypothetical protein
LCVVEGLDHAEGIESSQTVLVPQRVQEGTLVCVLDGDSSRMVFHPVKSSESSEESGVDDYFTFIGMCYFHSSGRPGSTSSALYTKKTFFLQVKKAYLLWTATYASGPTLELGIRIGLQRSDISLGSSVG